MIEPPLVIWVPEGSAAQLESSIAEGTPILGAADAPTIAAAVQAAGRSDLVVVWPGVELFDGWAQRLVAAAASDTTIATASALLAGGRWAPEPLDGHTPSDAAASVAEHAARLRPRVSEPQAGCVLLRRAALDVAGAGASSGEAAASWLAEFGERCAAAGLGHVLADDVLADASAAEALEPAPSEAAELDERWPHRAAAREADAQPDSPPNHALLVCGRGLDKLSVTVDGRALDGLGDGTQVHALELIAALGRTGEVALRVLTPQGGLHPQAQAVLDTIDGLTLLSVESALGGSAPATDVVHRPSQAFDAEDLNVLFGLGRRLVVTHQDLILYRIAGYHDSVKDWLRYRRVTRDVLGTADRVVFFSEHAHADARSENLLEPGGGSVVAIGADHHAAAYAGEPRRPDALAGDDTPFLLCLGSDLRHKHHAFAAELLAALREQHGWDGRLVLAGPPARAGGAPVPAGEHVVALGRVDGDEKAWLLEHAAAVAYPSLYEGFGLIPFEAANAGTPCLFAAQASLAEVLTRETATLVPWDAAASAAAVAPLLAPGKARRAHVAALRASAERYRWDDTASALLEIYRELVVTPPRAAQQGLRERIALRNRLLSAEHERALEWQRYEAFREQIGSDGLGLVGPGGVLDAADQRALLALLARRPVKRPLLRAARAAYGLASKLRRGPMPDHHDP